MKIGLDIRMYGTIHGGIGRYAMELFPRILEMGAQNDYFLFYNKKAISESDLESLLKLVNKLTANSARKISLIETSSRHYSLSEQISFLRTLNKYNLDLAHFPNFNVPVFYKRPFVVTIHDMIHHKIGDSKKSHMVHFWAYKKVIEAAASKSTAIITVSEASKKDIAKYLQTPLEKIKVIYEASSLPTAVADAEMAEVKKRYLLQRPYFLFVGVLERKKNVVNLTRAFDLFLEKQGAQMDFVIVGKADKHYPEIKHKALDIKHSQNLVFTGEVDDRELAALYKGAYAFVSASLHEGFGLPGVEALGFGLPLLVSNVEVFNEIYDNAALYFNPLDPEDIAEKMNILVRDPQFYSQFSQKSLQRAPLFSWDKCADQTLALYNSVLQNQ